MSAKHEGQEANFEPLPENEFLILGGTRVVPLDKLVITIGRQHDNSVVIDDPRVSRHHAQLRAINGRYVIFDLNSTGGTFLNGHRTNQSVLYPGDIISLAGVNLHYVRDFARVEGERSASPVSPLGPGEHVTAILRTWFLRNRNTKEF